MPSLRLPGRPESVRVARRAITGAAVELGVEGDALFSLQLVVSELVGNAVRHASSSTLELRWEVVGETVRIEVCDDHTVLPRSRAVAATDERGRGLHLVEAVTSRWGAEKLAGGKVVWAEVSLAR